MVSFTHKYAMCNCKSGKLFRYVRIPASGADESRTVMPRESGASSNHGPIQLNEAVPSTECGGYWIARFRACEEFGPTFNRGLLLLPPSRNRLLPIPTSLEIGCCRFRPAYKCQSRINPTLVGGEGWDE